MQNDFVTVKVYLKSQRRPIKFDLTLEQAKMFFALFENENRYVRFGNLIFDKEDFRCAIYN